MPEERKPLKKEDKWYVSIALIFLAGAAFFAFIDALKYRSSQDILIYGLYNSLGLMLFALLLQIISWIRKGFVFKDIFELLILAPMYYVLGILSYVIYVSSIRQVTAFWSNVKTFSLNHFSGVIVFGSVISALLLFYFRLKCRTLYGLTEFFVGVFIATDQVSTEEVNLRSVNFYRIMLTASVYLMIRGLDNIYQGLKDEKKPDKAAQWILRKLRFTDI